MTVTEYKCGLMARDMKDNGRTTGHMDMESSYTSTEISTKGTGSTTKPMVSEPISM